MVTELLLHPKRQLYPPENNRHSFFFITKIPGVSLLMKMPSKLPSTEQIFTETSCMVPLLYLQGRAYYGVMPGGGEYSHMKVTGVLLVPFRG